MLSKERNIFREDNRETARCRMVILLYRQIFDFPSFPAKSSQNKNKIEVTEPRWLYCRTPGSTWGLEDSLRLWRTMEGLLDPPCKIFAKVSLSVVALSRDSRILVQKNIYFQDSTPRKFSTPTTSVPREARDPEPTWSPSRSVSRSSSGSSGPEEQGPEKLGALVTSTGTPWNDTLLWMSSTSPSTLRTWPPSMRK